MKPFILEHARVAVGTGCPSPPEQRAFGLVFLCARVPCRGGHGARVCGRREVVHGRVFTVGELCEGFTAAMAKRKARRRRRFGKRKTEKRAVEAVHNEDATVVFRSANDAGSAVSDGESEDGSPPSDEGWKCRGSARCGCAMCRSQWKIRRDLSRLQCCLHCPSHSSRVFDRDHCASMVIWLAGAGEFCSCPGARPHGLQRGVVFAWRDDPLVNTVKTPNPWYNAAQCPTRPSLD